ncbi:MULTISPECIES: fatty acid cis/trans isomerase [unclassified Agarivorans]|uniref:fatty acid cis/trans isomerase n=1 Tax=unclassified Agarivorans TaxID=2636026 RepID=UPI0026E21EF5|nr:MULTISPECIES: fatty acid cis/trans isomerase [unclassified Agarivorans]MDO6685162.1 fatty acid cis/trans isomerase [Agarivorans sp. 3_MG-2023]MDO6715666.1 fatty acid cis/trans isomerase [Agarivorans sp. 2_MG-2023]
MFRRFSVFWLLLLIAGCSTIIVNQFDQRFGEASVQPRVFSENYPPAAEFLSEVKPILDQRCVMCHACYDAPCQLKLTSAAGIDRGVTTARVYHGSRVTAAPTTRLYTDAKSTQMWRQKGFNPVLNERVQTEEANLEAGVMYQALKQKRSYVDPGDEILDPEAFDFALDRAQQCVGIEGYAKVQASHPEWGMPYGLPEISDEEFDTLTAWLASGAPMADDLSAHNKLMDKVEQWEALLNGDSKKQRLMARYIYEHLFITHLYFADDPNTRPAFFKLVRSRTAPGNPIDQIATRRPYDDPKVERVYYRLAPERESIVVKTHIPYRLDQARAERWKNWFLGDDTVVNELPGYEPKVAGNPFVAFQDLTVNGRYRFMLDDAETFIMGFMKGPVCRGQVALNVIQDHFWVYFANPDNRYEQQQAKFLVEQSEHLRMPSVEQSNVLPISTWISYSKRHRKYIEASIEEAKNWLNKDDSLLNLDLLWDGDGDNPNAALTIFRHFDSASVLKGTVGKQPKTAWVIDYSLFERIHYLLVAGFDPYGNLGHQLVTRLYMDFLRMEGEGSFTSLLPAEVRYDELRSWYVGADKQIVDFVESRPQEAFFKSAVEYQDDLPYKQQLFDMLDEKLAPALPKKHDITFPKFSREISDFALQIDAWKGGAVKLLPQVVFIQVDEPSKTEPEYFTLLRHNAHTNISSLFLEDDNRIPDQDHVSLLPGLVGAYPGAFWQVQKSELKRLQQQLVHVNDEASYQAFMKRYGIRRTSQEFWPFSDRLHQAYLQAEPLESGILDYSRLENR